MRRKRFEIGFTQLLRDRIHDAALAATLTQRLQLILEVTRSLACQIGNRLADAEAICTMASGTGGVRERGGTLCRGIGRSGRGNRRRNDQGKKAASMV